MTDIDRLEERLTAVERTVIDGEHDFDNLDDVATLADSLEGIGNRLDELSRRVAELEAESESIQGYIANVDSINEDVAKQAASAVAATESLAERVEALEHTVQPEESVDKYRPVTGGDPGGSVHLEDDGEIDRTVEEIVAGTERDRTLGRSSETDGAGNGNRPGNGSRSVDRPPERSVDTTDRRTEDDRRDADHQEVRNRFEQGAVERDRQTSGDESERDSESGGLFSSLRDVLS